jgi:predicted ABC-type ATPase
LKDTGDKLLIVFAGPNGSGKSTARDPVLAGFQGEYINADDIAASMAAQIPDYTERNIKAANIAEQRRAEYMGEGKSFAFETVMSTPEKIALFSQARERGYEVSMVFVTTEHPDINVARVAARVEKGQHGVDETKIRERYASVMALLPVAVGQVDNALIYDNSLPNASALLVATKEGFEKPLLIQPGAHIPEWASVTLQNEMNRRTESLASFAKILQDNDIKAPRVALAEAMNGKSYTGVIVAVNQYHALQEQKSQGNDPTTYLVHDRALIQQKQLSAGVSQSISYAYEFGKIKPLAHENKPPKSQGIER